MKYVLVLLLLSSFVSATTIQGTVYDFGLNKVSGSIVEINTTPLQKFVAKNGTYSFEVPAGRYLLEAIHVKSNEKTQEEIVIASEGRYVIDLILLPDVDADLLDEPQELPPIEDIVEDTPASQWFIWLAVFLALGYIIYRLSKAPKTEVVKEIKEVVVSQELDRLVHFVEKEGGRTTQKEIRHHFPHSEAKISLMIDELESKGVLKKVKKGRGNIVIKV
ncbi:hypothetical protein J4219_02325 [Candidatus Woesearchaeota archaeon]|nr:hypothetical protein [Candidatus Woesearchaeota archaeon]